MKLIKYLKRLLKSNKRLWSFLVFISSGEMSFTIYRKFNKPFVYKLLDGRSIKLFPKGQISFPIFTKSFERTELKLYQNILRSGMIVVDAGANIGLHSLIASKIVGSNGMVFSFEPSVENFNNLKNNVEINKAKNILLYNKGLGSKSEKLLLKQDEGYGDAEKYLVPDNKPSIFEPTNVCKKVGIEEEIIIDTLDNCLEKSNIKEIQFLKIDTEGFEYYILTGAIEIIKNSPDIVILTECTPFGTARANTTQKDVFKFLKGFDLNIFFWDSKIGNWSDDETGIYESGLVWVCRNINQLN